jgi:hypothetical protein
MNRLQVLWRVAVESTIHLPVELKNPMKWALGSLISAIVAASILPTMHATGLPHDSPRSSGDARSTDRLQWQGAASCAAASCHGGNKRKGSKFNEYSTWADHDAHGRAYSVLFDERSVRIAKNLHLSEPAHESSVCLVCHAASPPKAQQGPRFQVSDGVSCEACHGPAEKWLAEHYLPAWKEKTSAEREPLGFRSTKSLLARARACVECHVGRGDADVNHDLLAAGHPGLQFEYNAFLAAVPKHWSERDEKARYPDFEARAWLIGQAVTAKASLDLLEHRATKKDRIWPEFAEYECAACHHNVGGRPARTALPNEGLLPWADWTTTLLSQILTVESGANDPVLQSCLMELRKEMTRALPERERIAIQTRRAAERLDRWANRLNQARRDDSGMLHNLFTTLSKEDPSARTSADRAVLRFLGMRAIRRTLLETAPEQVDAIWKPLLDKLGTSVQIPLNERLP